MQHLLLASLALRLPIASRREALLLGTTGLTAVSQRATAAEPGGLAARAEELKTLGTRLEESGRVTTEAEHWPGRLQGQPPPTPAVILRAAPPFVILPGFGNDQADYVTPNGLPAEVGLQAALARRGADAVSVVPIVRTDWINVARGVTDFKFVTGDAAQPGQTPRLAGIARLLRLLRTSLADLGGSALQGGESGPPGYQPPGAQPRPRCSS